MLRLSRLLVLTTIGLLFATATVRNRTQAQRFSVPGEYRLYCSIHPVQMSQVVRVR